MKGALQLLTKPHFRALACIGALLSAVTMSDGFLYLLLQQRSGLASAFSSYYV